MGGRILRRTRCVALAAVLSVGVVTSAYPAPEPPAPDERLAGPATVGTLTLIANPDGTVLLVFGGHCSQLDVTVSVLLTAGTLSLPTLTADGLRFQRVTNGTSLTGLGGCYAVQGDLVVEAVTRFSNNGLIVSADVVVLAVVHR